MKVSIIGASGKLGQYMVQHALDRGYEVVGVCREKSVTKLDRFEGRITVVPGATNEPEVIRRAVAGCDGVLFQGPLPARALATHASPPHVACSSLHSAYRVVLGFSIFVRVRI